MIRFDTDYVEGAHPKILKRIVDTNFEQTSGYGNDEYTKAAIEKIREVVDRENVDVHFLPGGTITNTTVIKSILKPFEAAVCVQTGHINTHEAGAIEATGHKIITVPSEDGKITAEQIEEVANKYNAEDTPEHMVIPKLVFIAVPTECGTMYTKEELNKIYNTCKANNMYLYLDGARLGYGLCAKNTDLTMKDMPKVCDVFYIGGTKQGALYGEAVVIVNDNLKENFRWYIKQGGGLLSKGRLLALQFLTLFEKDLYFQLSRNAVELAMIIKEELKIEGYELAYDSYTNQQFVVLTQEQYNELSKEIALYKFETRDDGKVVARICTSWSTTEEQVSELIQYL